MTDKTVDQPTQKLNGCVIKLNGRDAGESQVQPAKPAPNYRAQFLGADQSKPKITPYNIVVDTREKQPYTFPGVPESQIIRAKLDTGDYSIEGFEHLVSFERKSFEDFLGSITYGRKRFFAEIARLTEIPHCGIIIECDFYMIAAGHYDREIAPSKVMATINAIETTYGVHVWFLSDRAAAQMWMKSRLDYIYAKCIDK